MSNPNSPLEEPAAEPGALDVFFGEEPETFTDADLAALVAAQRAERERRLEAAAAKRRRARKPTDANPT
jgi:hypothetical protein